MREARRLREAVAPLLVWRTHPVAATLVAAVVVAALPGETGATPPVAVPAIVLAYACGAHAQTRPGLLAVVALAVGMQVGAGSADAPNLEIAIVTLPPWWGGVEVRRRQELVRELAQRTRQLEAEEEAFVRLSVQRERARIARDLHDIVSHHLAVIVITAGAGRLSEPWNADVADGGFATIREAGGQALRDADRLVTVLHADGVETPRLEPLLAQARAAGADVTVTPEDLRLAPDVEAIAYRVVQEALTNAMKHAPGAPVGIDLALADDSLSIAVRSGAAAAPSPLARTGSGLGLAGMRERLEARGGRLEAAADDDGGFRLAATVPLGSATT